MNFSTFRRKIAILLLGVSLLASAASAADVRGTVRSESSQFLARLVAVLDFFWEKAGGMLDPNGLNQAGASLDPWGGGSGGSLDPRGQKNGASLDPNGGPTETGGMLDPDGRPTESGGMLDPWGLCAQSGCNATPPQ